MFHKLPILFTIALLSVGLCAAQEATRITEANLVSNAITKVQPEYPSMAKQMKVTGTVEIDVYVDETGQVEKVESVKGNAILFVAAQRALKQWKFKPFKVGDVPGKVVARMGIVFNS